MSIQLAAVSHLFASLVIVLLSVALWYIIRRVYRSAVDTAVFKGARATMVRVSAEAGLQIPYNQCDLHIVSEPKS